MTKEEVMISLGVDNTSLNSGLVSAETKVKNSANRMTASLKGTFGTLRSGLLGGGLMNIFGIGEGIGAKFEEFKRKAASLGQWWGAFSVGGIKAARAVEGAFAAALRAGDKARKLNQKRWADEMAAEKSLADFRANRDKEETKSAEDLSELKKEEAHDKLSDEEKIKENNTRLARIQWELNLLADKGNEAAEHKLGLEKEKKKLAEENLEITKRQNAEDQRRFGKIHDAFFGARSAVHGDRQFTTVDELAGAWGMGSQFQDEAQRIKQLERFEKYNRSGFRDSDIALADKQQAERLRLTGDLVRAGAIAENPVVTAIESLNETVDKGISVKELQGDD